MSKGRAIAFALLTAALTAVVLWRPSPFAPSSCMSKRFLRVSCPGCGMTRSVTAAAQLRLGEAVRFHALGPIVLLGGIVAWALLAAGLVADRNFLPDFGRPAWGWAMGLTLGALMVYWVVRLLTGTLPP
jgi:Protein of unknown function (DUF2752)